MGKIKGKLNLGKNLAKVIKELEEGQGGWTEPCYLDFDFDLMGYLNLYGIILKEREEGDNESIYVKKIGPKENDYFVDISNAKDYCWERLLVPPELNEKTCDGEYAKIKYEGTVKVKSIKEKIEEAIEDENFELVMKLRDKKRKR